MAMTSHRPPRLLALLVACALFSLLAAMAAANEETDYGYGFYRTVEGKALLTGLEQDAEPLEIEPNYPVLTGDRIWVEAGSRVEAILPDRAVVRLGAETELFFESLAGSADSPEGAATELRLFEGEIQIAGDSSVLSDAPLTVVSENSRMYLQLPGTYRLTADGRGWTEVAVREGFAEINTERGSVIARPGEAALVEGDYRPEVTLSDAGPMDDLEYWGSELSGERLAQSDYVDDSLAYAAAPLDDAGEWVAPSGRVAWRPSVRVGWRPFSDGWWVYTPSGLSWVAYEPWGWVTSHYGAWDYVPGYGWLWFPGTTYSPAWVYWYWGPTHSAWIPSGYYTRYYGARHDFGFRFGVYGWAGGSWDRWNHWTFCPTRYFGRRGYRSYWRSGHDMHRDRRLHAVPRGIITTDTRDLHPRHWGKPTEIVNALESRHARTSRSTRTLGDVTSFVERRSDLPEDVRRIVRTDPEGPAANRGTDSSRGSFSRAAPRRTEEGPWRVERPDAVRRVTSREQTPTAGSRGRTALGTDWELIERLRRFENKEEGLPASPRSGARSAAASGRRVVPREETPTSRILDGVRSRDPRSTPERRTPAASRQRPSSPPASKRPPSTSSGSNRPERPSGTSARPSGSSRRSGGSMSKPSPSSKPSSAKARSGSTSRSSARKKN
jgi:hypothetical protein